MIPLTSLELDIGKLPLLLMYLNTPVSLEGVEDKISKALKIVGNISERYIKASPIDKRAIVSLIYPEKIIFDGSDFQTPKINSFVDSIFLIRRELGEQKKGI